MVSKINEEHSKKKPKDKIILIEQKYITHPKKKKRTKNVLKIFMFETNLLINCIFLLSLISRINIISNSYEVTIKVNGIGYKNIVSSNFDVPDNIYINGRSKNLNSGNQIYVDTEEEGKQIKFIYSRNIWDFHTTYQMFYGCVDITEIDLSKFDTSNVKYMDSMFCDCSSLTSLNFQNLDTTNVETMTFMFDGCTKLETLDISNFNTEKVVSFFGMFKDCLSLKSIDLSNFKTSSTEILWAMFANCKALTSIDLSGFDTSQVTNFASLFSDCVNLEYINLKNFYEGNNIDFNDEAFYSLPANAVICINENKAPELYSSASQILCVTFSCDSNWRSVQKKIVPNSDTCVESCSSTSYRYEYLGKCYSNCPSGTLAINNVCCECDSDCEECESDASNCLSCKNSNLFLNNGKCVPSCTHGHYTDSNSIKKCCTLEKCSGCSKDSIDDNLCTACYTGYYPKYDDRESDNFDCYQSLDGYYLDTTNTPYYFKQCYSGCENCDKGGNDNNHNCIECKSDYNLAIEFGTYKNCYERCDNYYYLDEDIQIHCINNCPVGYSKLIKAKDECVNNCNKYGANYKYEYMNECYETCPEGTKAFQNNICVRSYKYNNIDYEQCPSNTKTDNEDMKCYDECPDEKFEYDSTCVSNCPEGTYRFFKSKRICITNIQENYYIDENDDIYKECHQNCKNCKGEGNDANNNCDECKSGFMFLSEPNKEKNCFRCSYNYYIDDSGKYYCTNGLKCPQDYKNIISEKKKCINKCGNDSKYKYEYKDKCYEICPDKTKAFHDDICVPAYKYNNIDYEICPSNTKTDNEDMKCYDECPDEKFEYDSTCLSDCPEDTYRFFKNRRICITNLQENYYLDKNDNDIYKECHENCKKCEGRGDNTNNNCEECKSGFMFLSEPGKTKSCFYCSYYYYIDSPDNFFCTENFTCPLNHKNFISEKKKCINICENDDTYEYEYNNTCYIECPVGTKAFESKICIQLYEYIKNNTYYRECPSIFKSDHEVKKCYDECPEYKFEYNNSCWTNCPNNTYRFFIDRNRCLETLLENYYLDENDNIYKKCHDNCQKCYGKGNDTNNNCKECIVGFMFLYEPTQENNCFNCSYYYYIDGSNNFLCTKNFNCPNMHKKFVAEKKKCINLCQYDSIYKLDYNGNCTINCPNGTYISDDNTLCINDDASEDDIFERKIENIKNIIINAGFGYNDSIGIMAFKVSDGLTMFAGYIEDIKNNTNRNSSSLDLGNCTDKLKDHYNLSENHPLVVILKNYKPEGFLIPKTDYEVLDPINSRILNLSYCENSKATVYVPADIDKNEEYLYDPTSDFYNDICYTYTSKNGTDITQKDRQDEFVSKKLSLCDNNCKYEGYDETTQQSICTCDIQNKAETIGDLMNDEVQRPEEFTSNEGSNIITTDKLKCLSFDGLKTVILSYILAIITLYFLFSIVSFIKCGFRKLKDDINKIISAKEREMIKNINNQTTRVNNNIYNNNLYNIKKNNNKNSPPVKGKVRFMSNEVQEKRYHRVLRSDKMSKMSSFNKMVLFNEIINKVESRNKKVQNKMGFSSKNTSIKNIKSKFINYNYSEYELSIMTYQEAFIYDKRSCCKYYIYLLRIKHPLMFSFCPTKDYNTFIIKSCIFFLSLAFHFLINFLFFSEDVIHQIYEDRGKYNYIYFIPKISISFAISNVITIMTKFIFLSESNIIEIKRQKSLVVAHNKTFKVISRLRCKYIFFFLLGSIFLFACLVLVSSFGVVYQNTELILLKNTLISFLISFIYPFFMNIFPSLFRICSLSTKKHNLGCIYNLSKLLQYL